MELVERVPRHLPVGLLVEIAERDRVHEGLVERFDAFQANGFVEPDRHPYERAVGLQLGRALPGAGPRVRTPGHHLLTACRGCKFFYVSRRRERLSITDVIQKGLALAPAPFSSRRAVT